MLRHPPIFLGFHKQRGRLSDPDRFPSEFVDGFIFVVSANLIMLTLWILVRLL